MPEAKPLPPYQRRLGAAPGRYRPRRVADGAGPDEMETLTRWQNASATARRMSLARSVLSVAAEPNPFTSSEGKWLDVSEWRQAAGSLSDLREAHAITPAALRELDRVTLKALLVTDGVIFDLGAPGTVVFVYGGGEAVEVEFAGPPARVVTLRSHEVERVDG